jgi:hypothetical protein
MSPEAQGFASPRRAARSARPDRLERGVARCGTKS